MHPAMLRPMAEDDENDLLAAEIAAIGYRHVSARAARQKYAIAADRLWGAPASVLAHIRRHPGRTLPEIARQTGRTHKLTWQALDSLCSRRLAVQDDDGRWFMRILICN